MDQNTSFTEKAVTRIYIMLLTIFIIVTMVYGQSIIIPIVIAMVIIFVRR